MLPGCQRNWYTTSGFGVLGSLQSQSNLVLFTKGFPPLDSVGCGHNKPHRVEPPMLEDVVTHYGSGAGSRLPTVVLVLAGLSTLIAVVVSAGSIHLQLKNYRKPLLQRMVVRIMVMVPIYAISSLIALFSLEAAFVIDAIRDIYEAFVIYCFFSLLLSYLGGERSLLILLHGRPPKDPVFPVSLWKREIDVSDPYTFLFLKRGILQYVQVKPILAIVTLILKAVGKYNEGDFTANSGYLYVSIVYNTSICLSLYCLAMFWLCINDDLKPFRPVPKFLCVKGILFFSFWQSIAISILVAAGVIKSLGPYKDSEHISLGLTDTLTCLEMPFFAIAHMYAFSYKDYIDANCQFVARMPMYYAFRDAFGLLDLLEDSKATLRGEGMDYREFEPAEGIMHQGEGRERRIKAGLRYSKGGTRKYWLPLPTEDTRPPGRLERGANRVIMTVAGRNQGEDARPPVFDPEDVVHLAPDLRDDEGTDLWDSPAPEEGYELPFGDPDPDDDRLFEHSKRYLFGDYNYPCIDVSSETARESMWDEEERVLSGERSAWYSALRGAKGRAALDSRKEPVWQGYGAVGTTRPNLRSEASKTLNGSSDGRLIDHDDNRVSRIDVKAKWTSGSGQASSSSSSSQSSSSNPKSRPSPVVRSPSPSGSQTKVKKGPKSPSPVLLPDAVDLVVEDSAAEMEKQARERRKGEPATRGSGLRRVYRRRFVTQSEDGEVASGIVREPDGDERVDVGEGILGAMGAEGQETKNDTREGDSQVETEVVVRTESPPPHARVIHHDYYDESNPWA